MSRAGAVPRLHFDHDAVPWKLCRHLGLRPVDEVGADTEEERDAEQRGEHGERGPHGGGSELRFVWWWCRRRRRQAHPLRRRCCKVLAAHGEGNTLPAKDTVGSCPLLSPPHSAKHLQNRLDDRYAGIAVDLPDEAGTRCGRRRRGTARECSSERSQRGTAGAERGADEQAHRKGERASPSPQMLPSRVPHCPLTARPRHVRS